MVRIHVHFIWDREQKDISVKKDYVTFFSQLQLLPEQYSKIN